MSFWYQTSSTNISVAPHHSVMMSHLQCKKFQALYIACCQMGGAKKILLSYFLSSYRLTRDPSSSIWWWDQRISRTTASRCGEVHKNASFESTAWRLKCHLLSYRFVESEKFDNIPALEWGKHEVDASKSFMQNEGTKHSLPKLFPCGLFSHKPRPYMRDNT